ncbi:cell division protein ZapA [Nitrosomonas sp. ANs5]|uniref:cell division protein ZapA n=1 Tax=Nitrosomonas sp. ANs5 TaxID=3423941 RepID=UPI003D34CDE0
MAHETTLDVTVMGREFRIHCTEAEREGLLLAVSYLEQKMQAIKQAGKIVGTERIAIAAALSITHELLNLRAGKGFDIKEFKRRIESMVSKLDNVLSGQDHPDTLK